MSIDALNDDYLGSAAVAACFGAQASLAHMLSFEVALANAAAALDLIPAAAAPAIAAAASARQFDVDLIRRETVTSSNPAIPLVRLLTERVAARDAEAARYVHWGSTSQDVVDTALMLSCRTAGTLLEHKLDQLATSLAELADTHRGTPMVARTLSQHAGPTTFGVKAAGWLCGVVAARTRLRTELAALPLQFGGANGTLAAFDQRGFELAAAIAGELGLRPTLPWHTERGVVRALAAAAAGVCAAAGKVATDIVLLAQTEVAELAERADGRGGSSAMPHKHNPVGAIATVAAAQRAPGMLATVFAAFDQQHERAAGAWHAESRALAELFVVTGGAVERLADALSGLAVDTAAMHANLALTRGLVAAEAVAMALAPALGRDAAYALVKAATAEVRRGTASLGEVLARDARVVEHLGTVGLAFALDPAQYLGMANDIVETALTHWRRSNEH